MRHFIRFCVVFALLAVGRAQATLPIQTLNTASGARVYLIHSPSLPMVDVQIDFDAGERRDPPNQVGLASAVASMTAKGIRAEGRWPALDENQLGEAWADLGASFGVGISDDRLSATLRTLSDPALLARAVTLASR